MMSEDQVTARREQNARIKDETSANDKVLNQYQIAKAQQRKKAAMSLSAVETNPSLTIILKASTIQSIKDMMVITGLFETSKTYDEVVCLLVKNYQDSHKTL